MASELLPDWSCLKCTAAQKSQRGCTAKPTQSMVLDGEELERCPRRPILDDPQFYGEFFRLYRAYQKGLLPEEGALNSQPYKLMEFFTITDLTLELCAAHRRETEAKKAARGRRARAMPGVGG